MQKIINFCGSLTDDSSSENETSPPRLSSSSGSVKMLRRSGSKLSSVEMSYAAGVNFVALPPRLLAGVVALVVDSRRLGAAPDFAFDVVLVDLRFAI